MNKTGGKLERVVNLCFWTGLSQARAKKEQEQG